MMLFDIRVLGSQFGTLGCLDLGLCNYLVGFSGRQRVEIRV